MNREKSYTQQMTEALNSLSKQYVDRQFDRFCLCEIAVMLAVIADILVWREKDE